MSVDLLPTTPIEGVIAIQGDFMLPAVQNKIKSVLRTVREDAASIKQLAGACQQAYSREASDPSACELASQVQSHEPSSHLRRGDLGNLSIPEFEMVDVVLSDMLGSRRFSSECRLITPGQDGQRQRSPYSRPRRQHGKLALPSTGTSSSCLAKDLCNAALDFAWDALKEGGTFLCKFYQGSEDKRLESRLRTRFRGVYRVKPASSRNVSTPRCCPS